MRIWDTATRKLEFVLTGHAASVNIVRWGGENVIYTGSSDRTVKVWSGVDVRGSEPSSIEAGADIFRASSYERCRSTRIG